MAPSVEQIGDPPYPPKRRRKSLLDDRVGRGRHGDNPRALNWSRGITSRVLVAQGRTPVSAEEFRELHAELFPVGWPRLRNLRDGWIARTFRPLVLGTEFLEAIGDVAPPPTTLQLGIFLGWKWPAHPAPLICERSPTDPLPPLTTFDGSATAALVDGFRSVGAWTARERPETYKAAKTWDKKRSRNAEFLRSLEARMLSEGVAVVWSDKPNTEPCLRSVRSINGDGLSATSAQVVGDGT